MITYSKALELAQAGFPQPETAAGQTWYNHGGDLCWIAKRLEAEYFTMCKDDGQVIIRTQINKKYLVFVPTIADLLQQMPGYKLSTAEIEDDEWVWQVWSPGLRVVYVGLDPNTVLAEYWLVKKAREKCKEHYSTSTT